MRAESVVGGWLVPGALLLGIGLQGCGGGGGAAAAPSPPQAAAPAAPKVTAAVRARARELYTSTCAACHGETGKGDGPGAAGLDPKPRNFGDPAWQAGVSDEAIEKVIVYGGAAVGKSAQMPAHPMFKDSDALRAALRELVREMGPSR